MRTSYSALDTYKTCPLKYKYQAIDKIKGPKRIEAVFGSLVHYALKFMFERGPLYPTLDEVINLFTKKFNEKSENVEWVNFERKEEEEKRYYEEGVRIIKNFYRKNKPWNFNAVELESRFSLPILDEKSGETHTLVGIIDRIDKNLDSNIYEIIDYKTGKKMPSQEMLEDNLQLGVYQLSLLNKWPNLKPQDIKTSLYFLKHNEKITANPDSNSVARTKERILDTINNIEKNTEENNFPPTPGPLCGWCSYRKICPMWSHEYTENKKPETEEEMAKTITEFFELKVLADKNKKRITELRSKILYFMEQEKVERVFGDEGYITKNISERPSFNLDKIKPILESLGKWKDILSPDSKKIEELLPSLPDDEQKKIIETMDKKEVITLKQSKK